MDNNILLAYQPDYYKSSKVIEQINTANAAELTILNNKVTTEYNNMYPDTADSNNLSRFEKDNGLTILPDYETSYRRSRIYSRMIGQGKFTKEIIESMAKSFNYGDINVTLDLANFKFTIKFISKIGIPPNIDDLKEAIEEIKPAYLEDEYKYSYLLIKDVNVMTLSELNATVLNKFAMGVN